MINTEKNIYVQEREAKPNSYAIRVLYVSLFSMAICWIMNEIGLFRVGDLEMRIGSVGSILCTIVPLIVIYTNKKLMENPKTKYFVETCAIIITACVSTLLTFHTTIMLLYPIFIAMLYRSKKLGYYAIIGSISLTILSPIVGYMLGTWDVPLFQELILIATGGGTIIVDPTYTITMDAIFKILLYIVFPRLTMVGSCSLLLFYVIDINNKHIENQILLDRISHRDSLTKLFNQNYYKEVIHSEELNGQIGFIYFDCNGLKEANDLKGHEYGDLLLQQCGQSIGAVVDEDSSYGFRIGGDEFAIIIENANQEKIKNILACWQKEVIRINDENNKNFNGLTCSLAYGSAIGDAKDIDAIIHEADQKMYTNKKKYHNKKK